MRSVMMRVVGSRPAIVLNELMQRSAKARSAQRALAFLFAVLTCWTLVQPLSAQTVASYSPAQTTVGYQTESNLNVLVTLDHFVVPAAPRRAYLGGNEAQGGVPLTIVSATTESLQFVVAIPPSLRTAASARPVVLCQRVLLGSTTVDGFCTDAASSANFIVNAAPAITTPATLTSSLPDVPYSAVVTATGGTGAKVWSLQSGSLPPGIALLTSGTLSGTPTTPGTYNFTLRATDALGVFAQQLFTLTIAVPSAPLSITNPATLPGAQAGVPYSLSLAAIGGISPYTWMGPTAGLPAGLNLNSQTGVLSGTPISAGALQFAIQVFDAGGKSASKTFTLVVSEALTITTTSLPSGTVGALYSTQFAAANGAGGYSWAVDSGSNLPPGLSLNAGSGLLTGAPSQAGTFSFAMRVHDVAGASQSKQFQLTVSGSLQFVTGPALNPGTVGVPVSASITASGGVAPLTYSLVGANLPTGVTFSPQGSLTGAPTQVFDGSFVVRVTDSGTPVRTAERTFTWRVANPLTVQTESMPDAVVGEPYSFSYQVQGGVSPYSFLVTEGRVPSGLVVGSSGTVTGSAVATGEWGFTIRVTDVDGRTATRSFPIRVVNPTPLSASVTPQAQQPGSNTQQPITVALTQANAEDVTGELIATFTPSTNPPVDDPAIQFVSGGRVTTFRIPAGQTAAMFGSSPQSPALQMGTVAGEIRLALRLVRNGVDVTPSPAPSTNITLPTSAPVISDLRVTRTTTGLSIVVRGYSNARSMQSASLQFAARAGSNITGSLQFTVDLASVFTTWYGQTESFPHGSRFQLTIPANITGDTADINGLTIRLRNAQGESAAASATF